MGAEHGVCNMVNCTNNDYITTAEYKLIVNSVNRSVQLAT